jgi:uncharacterized membrane protein (UPF0127 family)
MKKRTVELIFLIIASIFLVAIYIISNQQQPAPSSFSLNNKTYNITSYASTTQQLEKGLMNVTVTNHTFMVFYFSQPGIYPFWMKDTITQLDIIWLNYSAQTKSAKVVYFVNATPCMNYDRAEDNCVVYTPNKTADYVLETRAGFVEQQGIENGTVIHFTFK